MDSVSVNGTEARDFLLFQNEREVFSNEIDGRTPFELKVRCSWIGGKTYEAMVQLSNTKNGETTSLLTKPFKGELKMQWEERKNETPNNRRDHQKIQPCN